MLPAAFRSAWAEYPHDDTEELAIETDDWPSHNAHSGYTSGWYRPG